MKYLIPVALLIISLIMTSPCSGQGINFTTKPWSEVLAQAKLENKTIFVDVYTKSCVPCKRMDKTVFSNSNVGKFFNDSLISYKLDANNAEQNKIIQNINIPAYPTLLYFSPAGKLCYYSTGFADTTGLIKEATIALNESRSKKSIAVWEEEYKHNKTDTAFLLKYINKRFNSGLPNGKLIEEYLNLLPQDKLYDPNTITLLNNNASNLLHNGKTYEVGTNCREKMLNQNEYGDLIDVLLMGYGMNILESAVLSKDENKLKLIYPLAADIRNPGMQSPDFVSDIKRTYFEQTGDYKKLINLTEVYVNDHVYNIEKSLLLTDTISAIFSLDRSALKFFNYADEKTQIKKALAWSEKSISLIILSPEEFRSQFYASLLATKGNLLYKYGETEIAINTIQEALDLMPDPDYKKELSARIDRMQKGEKIWE